MKKKLSTKDYPQKRKKQRTSKVEPEITSYMKAEVLDVETLREGMLLLGCVIEIRTNYLLMSLPGCLVGRVSLTNISAKYTEVIRNSIEDELENDSEISLDSIIELGALFPCKVLNISYKEKKKSYIELSINPQDVNRELKLSSFYLKMVLHVAVQSIEDHGYIMDIGIKGVQGFLPFSASSGQKNLTIGQIIPTSVRKLPSEKNGNVVWLSELSFNEAFPQVENENLKLASLLPGTNVIAYITEVKNMFLYAKCMNFDACASAVTNKSLTEADKVSGTILYIHPITHMIYLLLGAKPTPNSFNNFFQIKKFDLLKNIKYQHFVQRRLFFEVHRGTMGFVKQNEVGNIKMFVESLSKNPVVPKARVMFLHYIDNLVQLSFFKSMLELKIVRPEDVQVGDIHEVTVENHTSRGMFVNICRGLSGLVRQMHISDSFVTMPEKLHPVGTQIKCRVLSKRFQSCISLTSKESLLNLPPEGILKSYEQVQVNEIYKGVIVQKTDGYILVLFFNDIKGIVSSDHIPESSIFFVGQTVTCHVLFCNPVKKKLILSLMGSKNFTNKISNAIQSKSKQLKSKVQVDSQVDSMMEDPDPKKLFNAVVKSITARQLNILLDKGLVGRIHITELGCTQENVLPLKDFSVGMNLKVHLLGTILKKSFNYLAITHKRMKKFCECSFEYPPPIPLDKMFCPGMNVNGFIKEVGTISATLWLSPSQTGTLDYLHFSNNPKVLRRLKKKLKVGLSLAVNILEVEKISNNKSGSYNISLSKLENQPIKAGCNVPALVQIATPEKGLILKLQNGYHGVVCLTDLQDSFTSITAELTKCHKLSFILCHVLEVNHATKFCQLSLRKSRLYNLQKNNSKDIQPELTIKDLEQGKTVKGIVKIITDDHLIVNIGRMLDGIVSFHKCSVYGCSLCEYSQSIIHKFSIGDVLDVGIEGVTAKKNLYPVSLPQLADLGVSEHGRLNITEDIDWNEL